MLFFPVYKSKSWLLFIEFLYPLLDKHPTWPYIYGQTECVYFVSSEWCSERLVMFYCKSSVYKWWFFFSSCNSMFTVMFADSLVASPVVISGGIKSIFWAQTLRLWHFRLIIKLFKFFMWLGHVIMVASESSCCLCHFNNVNGIFNYIQFLYLWLECNLWFSWAWICIGQSKLNKIMRTGWELS